MIEIKPLGGKLGAEVRGVSLAKKMTEDVKEHLRSAFNEHILLLFRNLVLDDERLKGSGDWLGELSHIHMPTSRRVGGDVNIQLISNIRNDLGEEIGSFGDSDMWYHHDNSFSEAPDKATWLYAVQLPKTGGNTLFSNCYLSWEALPNRLKEKIVGKRVLQVYDYTVQEYPDLSDLSTVPHHWQPAVIAHPETKRPALYVNRLMSAAIEGMEQVDAAELLQEIFPYVERCDYEHQWALEDYLIWDNRCSAHARTGFPSTEKRLLKRGKVSGCPLEPFLMGT
jgi:taurine dioxygenase